MRSRRNPLTEVTTVRFSPTLKAELEDRAIDDDITFGEIVRRACVAYLQAPQVE